MRYNITVHVPQTSNVSYTLFAKGFNIEIPQLSEDESEYIFRFLGGTVAVLFYNFGKFKKAYVVTGWQDERDGEPINLPGVDGDLCILFSIRGKRFLILDKIIKYLTQEYDYEIFQMPLNFWYKLGTLIELQKTRKSYIKNIFLLCKEDGKNFYFSRGDIKLNTLEKEIVRFCSEPKGKKEIAEYCGYKNQRAFAFKYLNTLVEQQLLKYENGKYMA